MKKSPLYDIFVRLTRKRNFLFETLCNWEHSFIMCIVMRIQISSARIKKKYNIHMCICGAVHSVLSRVIVCAFCVEYEEEKKKKNNKFKSIQYKMLVKQTEMKNITNTQYVLEYITNTHTHREEKLLNSCYANWPMKRHFDENHNLLVCAVQ